jgi:hypothetical protein
MRQFGNWSKLQDVSGDPDPYQVGAEELQWGLVLR